MGLHLSSEEVAALERRTEGWIAGLQLAALSLQGRSDVAAFIRDFTGSHVYIAEYLIEEVLQQQAKDVQLFLLQTSILERMNSGLCEAVTDCQDSQARLLALQRANIFIVPLDDEGHWFRYHQMFADLLLARLQQNRSAPAVAALHLRASDWYEQHGFVLEAVKHALAAAEFARAAALMAQAGHTMLFTNPLALKNWLDALPLEQFHAHPCLEVYRVLIELSQGTLDMSEETLLEKERLIRALPPSPENDRLRMEALVFLCPFVAHQNTARAIQMAKEMLAEIPAGDLKLRAYLASALYRAYGMEGNIERSTHAYQECFRLAQAAGQYAMLSNTTMVRAFDLCQYGRMDEAAQDCQSIIEAGKQLRHKVFYPAGTAYIGLAGIYLEWNDLETAEDYLEQGLELCRQGGTYGLFTGYAQKARLQQAKGEFAAALAELQRLEQVFRRREFTLVARHVSIRLAIRDISGASQWVAPLLEILGDSPYAHQLPRIAAEAFKLSLARIYIAGGEIERASQLLDEIQATAKPDKRFGRLLEVYLLRALAEQKQQSGRISLDAVAHVKRALDLAEPAGFVLLLLEEGPALIPLLQAVTDQRAAPDRLKKYAWKLLNAFGAVEPAASHSSSQASGLIEALTPREWEVLQLIAAGDSNQAIAGKLVITVRTVKKHTTNIFGKLDADNRTQAVARARRLGLIAPD